MRPWIGIGLIVGIAFALLIGDKAMAKDSILASAIQGRLVDASGQPAAGVEIVRSWRFDGATDQDTTTTDARGLFALPAQHSKKRIGFLRRSVGTPSIKVTVVARMSSGEVTLAKYFKNSYDANSEGPGEAPLYFECGPSGQAEGFPFGTCRLVGQPPR